MAQRIQNLEILFQEATRKAELAKNILDQQSNSLDKALETATKKLNLLEDGIKLGNTYFSIPDPDKELLIDRHDDYHKILKHLINHVSSLEKQILKNVKIETESQVSRLFRLLKKRDSTFQSGPILDSLKKENYSIDSENFNIIIENLNHYFIESANSIVRKVEKHNDYDIFFLNRSSEKRTYTEFIQSIHGGLSPIVSSYNNAANAFVAYLAQPTSRDLLAEYGLVLFEDGEELVSKAAKVENDEISSLTFLKNAIEKIKKDLDKVEDNEKEYFKNLEEINLNRSDEPFRNKYDLIELCWAAVEAKNIRPAITTMIIEMNSAFLQKENELKTANETLAQNIKRTIVVSFEFLGRLLVICLTFGGPLLLLQKYTPEIYEKIVGWIGTDWNAVVISIMSSMIVAGLTYLLFGQRSKKPEGRFSFGVGQIISFFNKRKEIRRSINLQFSESIHKVERNVNGHALEMEDVIKKKASAWFSASETYRPMIEIKESIETRQVERFKNFSSSKQIILSYGNQIKTELTSIFEQKRKESVENVLKSISDTKERINQFDSSMKEYLRKIKN